MKHRRIVIKIGSNVLTRADGGLDTSRMEHIVGQVAELRKAGADTVLVSSGAVAAGRWATHADPPQKLDSVASRQLFSAIGQARLIGEYSRFFSWYGIVCGQVLTTKESLDSRQAYLNQRSCLETMLRHGVVPIINENDTISLTELMFTDNDELSGVISTMVSADILLILSNVDGLFSGDPSSPESTLIREVGPDTRAISSYISASKSSFGRGGMLTKGRIAMKVADEGIEVVIANGKKDGIITDICLRGSGPCTRFTPKERAASGIKKWIAHSDTLTKGEVTVDRGGLEAITGPTASSLLMVGVTGIDGSFLKGDIIGIRSPEGELIGVGKAAYGSDTARKLIGRRGAKPLIHYDYMYLE